MTCILPRVPSCLLLLALPVVGLAQVNYLVTGTLQLVSGNDVLLLDGRDVQVTATLLQGGNPVTDAASSHLTIAGVSGIQMNFGPLLPATCDPVTSITFVDNVSGDDTIGISNCVIRILNIPIATIAAEGFLTNGGLATAVPASFPTTALSGTVTVALTSGDVAVYTLANATAGATGTPPPAITPNPSSWKPSVQEGSSSVLPQAISLTSSGAPVSYAASSDAAWLTVTPALGNTTTSLTAEADPGGLTAGTYEGTVTISSVGAAPVLVPVRLHVGPPPFPMIGLGDSLGEGVQSADSSWRTQPVNYTSLIAQQMGVDYPLPLIQSWALGSVFSTNGRYRLDPDTAAANRAVSGAKVRDLLAKRYAEPVDTGTDLILMPEPTSQIEFAEQNHSPFTVVWIGSNDVDGAVLAWKKLNASQMTSVADFTADYTEMIQRLQATGSKVAAGTILDVADAAFLFTRQDLINFTGAGFGLAEGDRIAFPTALLLKLGLADATLLQDPNYVLTAAEYNTIRLRTLAFNQVIRTTATAAGFAVADTYVMFEYLQKNPPVFLGKAFTPRFAGGLICLDQLHPSNTGHALAANLFIQAANQKYGMNIPLLSAEQLAQVAAADPFVDWNGNLIVRGRPLAGFLETLGPALGLSGDNGDSPGASLSARAPSVSRRAGDAFRVEYLKARGLPASTVWTQADAIAAMEDLFPMPGSRR